MSNPSVTAGMLRRASLRGAIAVIGVVAVGLILLGLTGSFIVDWLWFSELGYLSVFWTTLIAESEVFLAVFVATAVILWINGALAAQFARPLWMHFAAGHQWEGQAVQSVPDLLEFARRRVRWPPLVAGAGTLLALLVAWAEVHNWSVFLRFIHQVSAGANDPLYGRDIGFYLFSLPAYLAIKNWLLWTLFLSALLAGVVYWIRGDIEYHAQRRAVSPAAIVHGSVLLGLFFAVKAWSYALDRYLLLYGDNGVVVGAGYTDIHVELPVIYALIAVAVVATLVAWANVRARTYRLPAAAILLVAASSVV